MEYEPVIGMEVHVELHTVSKMFCACSADFFGREPNTQICPICMGYPGVLPAINERAVRFAVQVGLAIHCQIASFSKFDRKNYTYPDLPKGYQISQYDMPLCHDGWLEVETEGVTRRIGIQRAHLEEDTAKTFHVGDASLVDFNRSGVPLLEIVTRPDIRSAEEARQFLIKLRTILRYLGVSTADMEKGAMRCEPNVSVRPVGSDVWGTKTEIKNLNSFRSAKLAIEYEVARQIAQIESGGQVQQATMGWDERESRTVFQRSKEGAEDYRYFPEPDLPPLALDQAYVASIRESLPELPDDKRDRFVVEYGIKRQDAEVLAGDRDVAAYYEACVAAARADQVDPQTVSNWVSGELFRLLNEGDLAVARSPVSPEALASLLAHVERGTINANTGKDVLGLMFHTNKSARAIIAERGLAQISDADVLEGLVWQAIRDHPDPVAQYVRGKETAIGFLIGQVMRASHSKANPRLVRDLMQKRLDALRDQAQDNGWKTNAEPNAEPQRRRGTQRGKEG